MTAAERVSIEDVLDTVDDAGYTVPDLVAHLQREGRYCCPLGCGSGGCESCPCCCAGWCVSGLDGIPEDADDRARWLAIAAEHNPVAAALRDATGRENA